MGNVGGVHSIRTQQSKLAALGPGTMSSATQTLTQLLPWQRSRTSARAPIGDGFGSECHLLRYLGRHRNRLNTAVMSAIPGASAVRWLDFHFDRDAPSLDGERKALDFLNVEHPARTSWTWVWPHAGTPITWDAVGQVKVNGKVEYLLVEAKAHLSELLSSLQRSGKIWAPAHSQDLRPYQGGAGC